MEAESCITTEMKATEKEVTGNERRKRNRIIRKNQTNEKEIDNEGETWLHSGNFGIDTSLAELEGMIHQFFSNKVDFLKRYTEEKATALLRKVSLDIIKVSAKSINSLEKINTLNETIHELDAKIASLLQQNLHSQARNNLYSESADQPMTYTAIASKNAMSVIQGKTLPQPQLPVEVRHSPAERVIILKAETKGDTVSKETLEKFRGFIKDIVGEAATEVTAIRPTRHGGYIIVARNEAARNIISEKIKKTGIISENRIVIPMKKRARMICRETPQENQKEEILKDLYGKNNPQISQLPHCQRMAIINITKLGWIFEISSTEAAAIEAQGSKVCYGFGCELRLEEFIPLQQCYRCCHFGHNAIDCTGKSDICRLCTAKGHCGRECPFKNDRNKWKCINCIEENQSRGLNLDIFHAAAQMHKCSVAEHEKNVKKSQLAASGVYTSKFIKTKQPIMNAAKTFIRNTGSQQRDYRNEKTQMSYRSSN